MRFQDKQPASPSLISTFFPRQILLSALDASSIGIVICDRRLRYKALNQTIAEMHNVPIEGLLGHSFHQALGSFAEKVVPFWESVFITGQPATNVNVCGQLPKRSDEGRWIENLFPLTESGGRITEVGGIIIEITPPHLSSAAPSSPICKVTSATRNKLSSPNRCHRPLLSHREREVLRLLAEGKSNKEISSILAISVRTVETYRARLMLKLDVNSIVHLVHYAIQNQIIYL